jgi:hypothetical protein
MSSIAEPTRADVAAAIRNLADAIEQHPAMPLPYQIDVCLLSSNGDAENLAALTVAAEQLGVEVHADWHSAKVTVEFGPVTYRAYACTTEAMRDHDARTSYAANLSRRESVTA